MPWLWCTTVPSRLPVAAPCVLQKLEEALKSALRSHLEDVSLALLMPPAHFDAYMLRKATKVNISCLCLKYNMGRHCRDNVTLHVTPHFTGLFCQQGIPLRFGLSKGFNNFLMYRFLESFYIQILLLLGVFFNTIRQWQQVKESPLFFSRSCTFLHLEVAYYPRHSLICWLLSSCTAAGTS